MSQLVIAIRAALVTLVLTGLAYPLVVTGLAQTLFPRRANGSLVSDDKGRDVGSELIGQGFTSPGYFHARPSASGYDAANSAGTNLAVTAKKLRDGDDQTPGVVALAAAYRAENDLAADAEIPADAVARSASGIDPHISIDNARLQVARIARARGVAVERVVGVLDQYAELPWLGWFGEPQVDVLVANLALDRTFGALTR